MPWTLYRYILRELVKLLVLVAVVMVGLISFVAAIKPMSEGLLGAGSLLKFVGYTSPTMLAFALPFAGAFASTLVFLRMASDNEIIACSASGMSYCTVMLPVAMLGLALTMGLFGLSNFVLPSFYRAAERTVEADVMSMLVAQLNQNRPFTHFPNTVLYADSAARQPVSEVDVSPNERQPIEMIRLHGVALARVNQDGRMRSDVTAQTAQVRIFSSDVDRSWAMLTLYDVLYHDPMRGELVFTRRYDSPAMQLPSPFQDSPQFFSWPELRRIDRDPERFGPIRQLKHQLAEAIAAHRLSERLRGALGPGHDEHHLTLLGPREGERYVFGAPSMRTTEDQIVLEANEDEPAAVVFQAPDRPDRRMVAASIVMQVSPARAGNEPTVRTELHDVRIHDPRLTVDVVERTELMLPRMRWTENLLTEELLDMNPQAIGELARDARFDNARPVRVALHRLEDRLAELGREIVSQLHARAGSAIACLMALLLGTVLSMHMRDRLPLVVCFWSFLCAILTLILINVGENMTSGDEFPPYVGLTVLWSGNVAVAILVAWIYCRLARN